VLTPPRPGPLEDGGPIPDLRDVKGQEQAKRALEIAAAGGHNLLMIGPPGSGKSMMAARLPGLLPPLSAHELLEVSMIHSVAGLLERGRLTRRRPFRAPHHSASMAALVGLYGEPLEVLHPLDLLGVARTLKRGKQLDRAVSVTQRALDRGAGHQALELRAQLAKARGDRARALSDFEALMQEVNDAATRLELAKLYEHFVGDPGRALELVEQGTDEDPIPLAKRRARLAKKIEQNLEEPVKRQRARRKTSAD